MSDAVSYRNGPRLPSADIGRHQLRSLIEDFLRRTRAWHGIPETERPAAEHGALAAALGLGKSSIIREALGSFIAELCAAGLPHRVLYLVPHHRLSAAAETLIRSLGLKVAVWRGREAEDPAMPGGKMCQNIEAVQAAVAVGVPPEIAACGGDRRDGSVCPYFEACAYQQQKGPARAADVVITANTLLFGPVPAAVGEALALCVIDEGFWQQGLSLDRKLRMSDFALGVRAHGVRQSHELQSPKATADVEETATRRLTDLALRVERAFRALPDGTLLSKTDAITAGLTVESCYEAMALERRRKVDPGLHPGMSPEQRKAALTRAAVNITLPRRAALWQAIAELLEGDSELTGRLERTTLVDILGAGPGAIVQSHRRVASTLSALPMLYLDATLPETIARCFLPRIQRLGDITAAAPFARLRVVRGGWGKTSLIESTRVGSKENRRRDRKVQQVRVYVALHALGNGLIITYKALEGAFRGIPGVQVAHFNAIVGLDLFRDVRAMFIIGRPLARSAETLAMARALWGRPIAAQDPVAQLRGITMRDGSLCEMPMLTFGDPDLEAVRAAVTDTEVAQAIGRGRAVNRTVETPLAIHLLADVLPPLPVDEVLAWSKMKPGRIERMAARGLVVASPADAAKLYPELFGSVTAAASALNRSGISSANPYEVFPVGASGGTTLTPLRYRPKGPGQQTRHAWCFDPEEARARLGAVMDLALFETL